MTTALVPAPVVAAVGSTDPAAPLVVLLHGRGSAENVQQLAIAQLRAVEAGRAVVNISTVGTSAMIAPDGTMLDRLPQYEPGAMLEELPLSTTITPGIRLGAWIDAALCIGAAIALAGLALASRGARRSTDRRSADA